MNEFFSSLSGLISSAVIFGTVIMFGALGEILTEKSGHLNLGIPGIVYLGGFGGWLGGFIFEKYVFQIEVATNVNPVISILLILITILFATVFALIGGLIYAFFTVTLRSNQNVTGLSLTYLSVGICSFGGQFALKSLGYSGYARATATTNAFSWCFNTQFKMGALDGAGAFFGKVFLSYGILIYAAIAIAIAMHLILKKTNVGLSLRSIGESPSSADAQGINVLKYKYFAICIGAAIAGLGGVTYVMNFSNGIWATANSIESLGWLAVALVIFTTWKPLNAIWGSYLFAALYWVYQYTKGLFNLQLNQVGQYALQMLPYLISIIVLIIVSLRKKKELQPPEALGLPYFREDR